MLHSNFNRLIATIRLCRRGCRHFHFQELCRRRLGESLPPVVEKGNTLSALATKCCHALPTFGLLA